MRGQGLEYWGGGGGARFRILGARVRILGRPKFIILRGKDLEYWGRPRLKLLGGGGARFRISGGGGEGGKVKNIGGPVFRILGGGGRFRILEAKV